MTAEQIARREMAARISAIKLQRGQTKAANPITAGELESAAVILREIGGNVPIVVVADTWDLSGGNPAICLADASQVELYLTQFDQTAATYDSSVDRAALRKSFGVKTILVKQSVLTKSRIVHCGTIWHEFGHTYLGEAETGAVFAHELRWLLKFFDKESVKTYIKDNREGFTYFAGKAVDPGLDELAAVLLELGFDMVDWKEKDAIRTRDNIKKKLKVGFSLSGDPASFPRRAATEQGPDIDIAEADAGTEFDWVDFGWVVHPWQWSYEVMVVESAKGVPKKGAKVSGELGQLKSMLDVGPPPDVDPATLESESVFGWAGNQLKLLSKKKVHKIEIVKLL